jgi:hypothetical protein
MDRVIYAYGSMGQLDFTLFRPFNWIGAGLDSIHTPKEGSSRVITQFLGHIVRGEPIKLVDGGGQKRAFTYIDDGIDALMRIIENKGGVATGQIYNVGNPKNDYSVRQLAQMMLDLAKSAPNRDNAAVKLVNTTLGTTARDTGQNRARHRQHEEGAGWAPKVDMPTALKRIFDVAHRSQPDDARASPIKLENTESKQRGHREKRWKKPLVGVVMGSRATGTMQHAAKMRRISACPQSAVGQLTARWTRCSNTHRTASGVGCIIAGGGAHLPGGRFQATVRSSACPSPRATSPARTRSTPSCRCPREFRSRPSPSARRARPTPASSR